MLALALAPVLVMMLAPVLAVAATAAAPAAAEPPAPVFPPPAIPPALIDETLDIAGEAIAARQVETRMLVAVRVNGRGPYRFVVDSGADRTVIGAALAARLALPPGPPVIVRGMAGASRAETVRLSGLRLGASDLPDIVAPALAERNLGADGLIGIDALAEQRLMLDFEKRTITVEDARRPPAAAAAGEIVVTARRRNGQLILTQVMAAGSPAVAVIDTGSQVTIGNMALLARMTRGRRRTPLAPVTLISVTGQTVTAGVATLPAIRIGGVTLQGVPMAFADVPPFALFGLVRQPALLLGTDTLEAFRRVSLDFRQRRVRFVLRAAGR